MSMLTAFPLLAIPVIIYNLIAFISVINGSGANPTDEGIRQILFSIPMPSQGTLWKISTGDIIILVGLLMLFFELLKSTSSQKVAIVNHALSMLLFIIALVEFLLWPAFATSTFFLLVVMILLDVLAGFIVTIITARKDFDFSNS